MHIWCQLGGMVSDIKKRKAQALIEVVLILPMLCILMSMITWFTRLVLTRQMLLTAARYGTDMIYYTDMNEDQIRQEIRNYLTDKKIEGRKLNSEKLPDDHIKIHIYRYPTVTPFNVWQPINFETSWVEIYYEFGVPSIFTAFSRYIGNAGDLPDKIVISARSEVLAGTGAKR